MARRTGVQQKKYSISCTVTKAGNPLISVLIYCLINYQRCGETRTQMSNLSVGVADESGIKWCKKKEGLFRKTPSGKHEIFDSWAGVVLANTPQKCTLGCFFYCCLCYPLSDILAHQNEKIANNIISKNLSINHCGFEL